MAKGKIVIFGLSTQGYSLASQMAIKGEDVYIIDESAASAILINADVVKTYPTVSSLKEDEPILSLIPTDVALSTAEYLFFAPRIRKTGQDIKTDINSKFKDITSKIKKGCSVIYNLPNAQGCDSAVTLDLTINYSNAVTDLQTTCSENGSKSSFKLFFRKTNTL